MEKAQRAELLRKRFKAVGGIPYVGSGRQRKAERKAGTWTYSPLPGIIPDTKRAPGWLKAADPVSAVAVAVKRYHGPTALTRIAEKWADRPCGHKKAAGTKPTARKPHFVSVSDFTARAGVVSST